MHSPSKPTGDEELHAAARDFVSRLGHLVREIAVAEGLTPTELHAELERRDQRG